MKTRISTSCCLLLLLAVPAWGQSPPLPAGGEAQRPLNLSLPRDMLKQPLTITRSDDEDLAARNLRQEASATEKSSAHPRYGTGYEARQRGMGTSMGGTGMGGGGRGGMGRGR